MGSQSFSQVGWGTTAAEAFADARQAAGLEHGFGEDNGSLAEKDSFRLISRTFHDEEQAWAYVHTLLHGPHHPAQDSASPAYALRLPTPPEDVCTNLASGHTHRVYAYVFFGYASC